MPVKRPRHPLQPIVPSGRAGPPCFRANRIVQFMLAAGRAGRKFDLNLLEEMPFTVSDREQLLQLLGYTLAGFEEINFIRAETLRRVDAAHVRWLARRAKRKDDAHIRRLARGAIPQAAPGRPT